MATDFKWVTKADIRRTSKRMGKPMLTVMGKNCGYSLRLNSEAKEVRGFDEDEFAIVGVNDEKIVIRIIKDVDKGLNIIREPFGFSISSKIAYTSLEENEFPLPCHIPITFNTELNQWEGLREEAQQYIPTHKTKRT